jgi:hypothetical protein
VATLEQLDYDWNLTATEDINFGSIAVGESKTLATAKDFTLDTKEGGYSFSLTVTPSQQSAAVQIETPLDAITGFTADRFSQDNGELDRFLRVSEDPVVKYLGTEYTFPVNVKLKSVTFVLGNTNMSSTNVRVFDVETGDEVAVTEEISISANEQGASYTAAITGGGVNLTAGRAYALMLREDAGTAAIVVGVATNKSNKGKVIFVVDGTLDWRLASYAFMIRANVEPGAVKIGDVTTQTLAQAARQGDNFLLSYPAGVSSVSVYNVAGQKVAEYKLNASGTYTMQTANLANGVYVLKFNGSNTVVKILK